MNLKLSSHIRFFIKIFSGAFLYFIMRITYINEDEGVFKLDKNSIFYLIFTTLLLFIIWEINDQCYRYFKKRYGRDLFIAKNIIKHQSVVILSSVLSLSISMYLLHFHLSVWLGCEWTASPLALMMKDIYKSIIMSLLFNLGYINIVFIRYKRNADLTEEKIKRESILFKYESLRNQIDPHFLFNSFSVLNTLIKTDTDLASQFLNQLSELYRYILDNKENNLITVDKELVCLEAYLFLMKIRHEGCIVSKIELNNTVLMQYIPTMSLQMLIENAIKHNSFNENQPLNIKLYSENDEYLVVTNRLNVRRTSKISAGIGLKNIEERYRHHSEKNLIFDRTDKDFIVKLPLLSNVSL